MQVKLQKPPGASLDGFKENEGMSRPIFRWAPDRGHSLGRGETRPYLASSGGGWGVLTGAVLAAGWSCVRIWLEARNVTFKTGSDPLASGGEQLSVVRAEHRGCRLMDLAGQAL